MSIFLNWQYHLLRAYLLSVHFSLHVYHVKSFKRVVNYAIRASLVATAQ